jgi:uncharacterized membrane protein
MSRQPNEVKLKLDELYWKTEDIRKQLISLHGLLNEMQLFDEAKPAPKVAPPPPVPMPPVILPPEKITQENKKDIPEFTAPVIEPIRVRPDVKKSFREKNPDLEKFIGERLVTFIGIIILVTGIAFFVKYAIDKNWIGEASRTGIGILSGGILLGFAYRLRKTFAAFSSVLAGGGITVIYFTISYAFQIYGLFSQATAFGLLSIVTAFTVALSVFYDRRELAILAIVGGFATPLMVSTGGGNFNVLCGYMLILDLGMLALAWYKKWNAVNYLCYTFTILLFAAGLVRELDHEFPRYTSAFVFASLFYLVFFGMNIINNVRTKAKFEAQEILVLLSNAFLYYACSYFILGKMGAGDYRGIFTILLGAFNSVFALLLFRRQEVDRTLIYFLTGLVITFVSLTGPVQLEGNHITLFWAAESALLFWLYQRSNMRLIRVASVIVTAAMLFGLVCNWIIVYGNSLTGDENLPLFVNKGFITGISVFISLVVTSILLQKEKMREESAAWSHEGYRVFINSMAWALLYFTITFELLHQLGANGSWQEARLIYWNAFTVLYLLASWLMIRPLKLEYMRAPVIIFSILLLILYVWSPHLQSVHMRDSMLLTDSGGRAFGFHYLSLAALVLLTAFVFVKYFRDRKEQEWRSLYLWLMCAAFVFMISAELDHLVVLARYDAPGVIANAAVEQARIHSIVAQNQKIGYPIAWGICSFIMIVTGIRQKERQLRIIALVLFAITIGKLVFLGVYGESQAGKIAAFIISGIILLLVSFMYQRLKKFLL